MTEALDIAPSPPLADETVRYKVLVEKGKKAVQRMDRGRWELGDSVRELTTEYRDRTVEQYAADVQAAAKSLYEYAGMATFYPPDKRTPLLKMGLTYTHLREARRLGTLEKAIEFLEVAVANLWTVDDMRMALKALRKAGHTVADTYSEAPPMTDYRNVPVEPKLNYQWRGLARVRIDKRGRVQLECETPPDLDDDKQYMVIFQEIER